MGSGNVSRRVGNVQLLLVRYLPAADSPLDANQGTDSIHGFYFRGPPIHYPPLLPIPGEQGRNPGDVGSSPSSDALPLPKYMGKTFPTMCRFWVIVQEVAALYFAHDKQTIEQHVPLAFAEAKYQKLLAWAGSMAADMGRGDTSPAHVLIFQYE